MDYQLIRSKRKTLSLQINTKAELIIRSPKKLSIKEIESFVNEKSEWIKKKQRTIQSKIIPAPNYTEEECFLYLGNLYPLIHNAKQTSALYFDGKVFSLKGDGLPAFHDWYKTTFKKVILPRLDYYANLNQLSYQKVRLKSQKTLWGSCSSVNNINLNYLLIQAPMNVIDYVIVHELAHIRHKNHSKNFWDFVNQMLPNYKASKSWLQENGHKLKNL
jgi:predicted metal-dependent hydrolase